MSTLLLASCSRPATPVAAYRHVGDKVKALAGGLFGYPCSRHGADYYEIVPYEDSYRLTEPRKMHGIWVNAFEGSTFIENAREVPADLFKSQEQTWLQRRVERRSDQERAGRIYLVDLVGRRSMVAGRYGHMGGSRNFVLIDRMISLREIPPPKVSTLGTGMK